MRKESKITTCLNIFYYTAKLYRDTLPFQSSSRCSSSTSNPQIRRRVRTKHLPSPRRRLHRVRTNLHITSTPRSAVQIARHGTILPTRRPTNVFKQYPRQLRIPGILFTILTILAVTALDLNSIVASINNNPTPRHIAHSRQTMRAAGWVCLYPNCFGRIDHRRAGYVHVFHCII